MIQKKSAEREFRGAEWNRMHTETTHTHKYTMKEKLKAENKGKAK